MTERRSATEAVEKDWGDTTPTGAYRMGWADAIAERDAIEDQATDARVAALVEAASWFLKCLDDIRARKPVRAYAEALEGLRAALSDLPAAERDRRVPLNVTMLGEAMAVLNEVYLNDRLTAYRDAERVAAEYARLSEADR